MFCEHNIKGSQNADANSYLFLNMIHTELPEIRVRRSITGSYHQNRANLPKMYYSKNATLMRYFASRFV